jgi:N-dimethylarginine dimethylaminohydrolase
MSDADDVHIYNMTMKMFGPEAEPVFESDAQQNAVWGRAWGCDNDVGRIRTVLMHRPGDEFSVVDPAKRIDEISAYGDREAGWYWQSKHIPPVSEMQVQHDALAQALRDEGAEVVYVDGVGEGRFKTCYTRDSVIAVKGGAVVTRLAARMRRGEEADVTRTLAALGMPILRTIHGDGLMEGGSFAWINSQTAVVGRSIRVNQSGIDQLRQVLETQGVELIQIDLCGYLIHLDGAFVMIDSDLALIDAAQLPYPFLTRLWDMGIETVEMTPRDISWIVNCLAVAPRRVLMPQGASDETMRALVDKGVDIVILPYDAMQLNGGGIHCSTSPLIRDPVAPRGA